MSQENVEVVQSLNEAWNAGNMDAVRALCDPEVSITRGPEGWPETGPFVGREAVMRQWEQFRATWDADAVEPISVTHAADRVAQRMILRTAGHGPKAKYEWTIVYTVREGKVLVMDYFWDHAEALETMGLSE